MIIGWLLGNWKLVAGAAAVAGLVAAFGWARWDAANDREDELLSKAKDTRIIHLKEDKESDDKIDTIPSDDLLDAARRWELRPQRGPQ